MIESTIIGVVGTIVAAFLVYLGVARSAKAQDLQTKSTETVSIINGYKDLQTEYKKGIEFLNQEFDRRLTDESDARKAIETELKAEVAFRVELERKHDALDAKFESVLIMFRKYVKWARGDRQYPEPDVPEWVFGRIIRNE